MAPWIPAVIVPGHRVASGGNGDARFPGGTIRMQVPHFLSRGLDLAAYHQGTVNVSIAPWRYCVATPRTTFRAVRWHPVEPAEDFSFFDVRVRVSAGTVVDGLIYRPHPETKPEHFQQADVMELLLPWTDGLAYGSRIVISVPETQMRFDLAPA